MIRTTIFLIVFVVSVCQPTFGQYIDNRFNVYAGVNTGRPLGNETINDKGFIMPSFFSNFHDRQGIQLKMIYLLTQNIGVGLSSGQSFFSNWNSLNFNDYNDASLQNNFVSTIFRYQSSRHHIGLRNKLSIYADVAPGLGVNNIRLKYPVFTVYQEGFLSEHQHTSSDLFYGLTLIGGVDYVLHKRAGIFLNLTADYFFTNSLLHNDRFLSVYSLQFGFYIRLLENKRFYY